MLSLDKMADQKVPRYHHINVADFVFFSKERPDHCLFFSSWKVRSVHFVTGGEMLSWLS